MRRAARLLLLAALLAAAPAATRAEAPMTVAEFEAYVTGRTLYYSTGGQDYGAEQYLPGRRVVWTFLDGECAEGFWYEEAGLICFLYELDLAPQCWSFFERAGGLAARFENNPAATELYEVRQSDEPLICQGPELGV
jgi:hypothetical protein